MTEKLVAPKPDDPALDALADALVHARALGLDVSEGEAVLAAARGDHHGPSGTNGSSPNRHAEAARQALTNLAGAAGLKARGVRDLIPDPAQRRGIDGAIAEVARILDFDTFEEQALALVRGRAHAEGQGPLKWWFALRNRSTKMAPQPQDPQAHLLAWRTRGVLTRAADSVRRAIAEALPEIPETLHATYTAAGAGDLDERLERGTARLVETHAPAAAHPPEQRRWRIVGIAQWLNVVLLGFAITSLVGGILGFMPVWLIHLPFFRNVPAAPFVLLLCPLIAFALNTGLNLHADYLGRIWASRIENDIRRGIRVVVEAEAFSPLEPVEAARARLGEAWHRILRG